MTTTHQEFAAAKVTETLWHHQTEKEWREVPLGEARNERLENGYRLDYTLDVSQPGLALVCVGPWVRALRPDGTSLLVTPEAPSGRDLEPPERLEWRQLVASDEVVQRSGWYRGKRGLVLVQWRSGRLYTAAWASDWAGVEVYDAHGAAFSAAAEDDQSRRDPCSSR